MPFLTPVFQNMLMSALNNNSGSSASLYATQFASALSSATASCLLNMGASPIPFIPSGFAATQNMIMMMCQNSNGNANSAASQLAGAIAMFNPLVPPVMQAALQGQLSGVFSNSNGSVNSAASQIANAINSYYSGSGLVI